MSPHLVHATFLCFMLCRLCMLTIQSVYIDHYGLSASMWPVLLHLFSSWLFSLSCPAVGQALERQKEYFDCIRNERDELRDELADLKGKSKTVEVCQC